MIILQKSLPGFSEIIHYFFSQKMSNFVNQKNEINMFCIDAKNCQISDYFERHDLCLSI